MTQPSRHGRRALVALAVALFAAPLALVAASVPNTFSNDTVADAAAVNANFNALAGAVTALETRMTSLEQKTPVTVYQAVGTTDFTMSGANSMADVPGLQKTITLARPSKVLAFYGMSGANGQHVVMRLIVNGAALESSESINGNTTYFSNNGQWMGDLGPGSYDFRVQYRTPQAAAHSVGQDHMSRSLHVVVIGG